ncbi:MAG: FAD-binding protein, partial [Coriobacteriales bacterium]|nr:FAD-binding protein [Coriobacteriales bacterium]
MTKANNTIQSEGVSRRGFLGGLAAFSGAVAMGAAGCSPKPNGGGSDGGSTPAAKASEADPIAPAAVPAAWDEESDVVVVGTGGGLVAAVYAAMNGKKVTVLEKAATWGGSSKETDIFSVLGTKTQQAIYQALGAQLAEANPAAAAQLSALGQLPPEAMRQQWMGTYFTRPNGGDTGELPDGTTGPRACAPVQPMLQTLCTCIPDAIDFMAGCGVPWGPVTMFGSAGMISGVCPQGSEAGGIVARANYSAFEILYNKAVELGVSFHFYTPATALVMDGDKVVGVTCSGEIGNVKANDGVILATGGMTFNQDMLKEYVPHVYHRCFNSTATSGDTGDGIRMGLGAGATISGYDSSFIFDGGVDNGTWGRYLYKGDVQVSRQPWCSFTNAGNRIPYYPVTTLGFTKQAGIHMHNPGHCSYVVFDSHYDEIIKNWDATGKNQLICRNPVTREKWAAAGDNVKRFTSGSLDEDYTIGMQEGIDAGYIFKADTLDELADKMGLQRSVVNGAVSNWNAMCDAGEDPLYHLDPAWLVKVSARFCLLVVIPPIPLNLV